MSTQRIRVQVVGFRDVERHALNTVFRLSETRELRYALWVPPSTPGGVMLPPEVVLVDGEAAEAVLFHARETPPAQRLIWVGRHAPAHAWRVLERPIQWATMLNEMDAAFAAQQVDSGFIDLDVTAPGSLEGGGASVQRRALIVGCSAVEQAQLRAGLTHVGLPDADTADSTESALECIGRHRYACGMFDLDEHHVDTWQLARLFAQHNPAAMTMGVSMYAGPLAPWLNRRRVRKDTARNGITALVGRPLQPEELSRWFELLH